MKFYSFKFFALFFLFVVPLNVWCALNESQIAAARDLTQIGDLTTQVLIRKDRNNLETVILVGMPYKISATNTEKLGKLVRCFPTNGAQCSTLSELLHTIKEAAKPVGPNTELFREPQINNLDDGKHPGYAKGPFQLFGKHLVQLSLTAIDKALFGLTSVGTALTSYLSYEYSQAPVPMVSQPALPAPSYSNFASFLENMTRKRAFSEKEIVYDPRALSLGTASLSVVASYGFRKILRGYYYTSKDQVSRVISKNIQNQLKTHKLEEMTALVSMDHFQKIQKCLMEDGFHPYTFGSSQ